MKTATLALVLATLGGEIELRSARRVRRVAAKQFFRSALVTSRGGDELITALHWPRASSDMETAFFEFAVREGDFAIVAVACAFERRAGRMWLGFGGCGDVPQVVEVSASSGTNTTRSSARSSIATASSRCASSSRSPTIPGPARK